MAEVLDRWRPGRAVSALSAGAVAIALNTLALGAANLVPLATARGGLLRLLLMLTGAGLQPGPGVTTGFDILVGLAMAVVYAYALDPWLPGPGWFRGLLYAVAVWLPNAAIVLPATGEGFAGSKYLTLAGMIWFAAAHTLFFVVLGACYAWLRPRTR